MRSILTLLVSLLWFAPQPGAAAPVAFRFEITTAYALTNPFPNRIDSAFTEPDTGYVSIANAGPSTFTGSLGITAASVFAGDLSFKAAVRMAPGDRVSIAIPDDSSDVGGFAGPAYFARPGIVIFLAGSVADGPDTAPLTLSVADADIHSGVTRLDPYGLFTDSFVLQGGDPWGFDAGDAFELSQAPGHYLFQGTAAPEPARLAPLLLLLPLFLPPMRRRPA